ncbi:MAG: hypothetical protein MPL62_05195 [Alphaproteobacteria bacterium]|nr:hypothetical protein [Alphaproteobacteria bacterium]MDA8000681.1 hypothetical protein [Alphaproteobacteria bacterium]
MILGISGRWTKTFTVLAQAGGAGRWVRASPRKLKFVLGALLTAARFRVRRGV